MSSFAISPFNFLEQVPELRDLPKPDLNYLLSKSSIVEMKNGGFFFEQGEKAEYVYFVMEGKVSMEECSPDGKESINCIARGKDWFCCLPALDKNPYPVSAVSTGPVKAVRTPIHVFQEICLKHPAIYQKFVLRTCSNLRAITNRHSRRMDTAASRVASLLMNLSESNPGSIHLTRSEIAKLVGITIETAIRILSQMEKDKIIQSTRGTITLANKQKLSEMAGCTAEPSSL